MIEIEERSTLYAIRNMLGQRIKHAVPETYAEPSEWQPHAMRLIAESTGISAPALVKRLRHDHRLNVTEDAVRGWLARQTEQGIFVDGKRDGKKVWARPGDFADWLQRQAA
jgi:hypothetical protein